MLLLLLLLLKELHLLKLCELLSGDLDHLLNWRLSLRRRCLFGTLVVPSTEVSHEGLKVPVELVVHLAKVYRDGLLSRALARKDEVLRKVTVPVDDANHADELLLTDADKGGRIAAGSSTITRTGLSWA